MEQVITIAKSISELGLLIVIAAAFIYMVYQNWKLKNDRDKSDQDNYQKIVSEIQNQNNTLVEKLIQSNKSSSITSEQYSNRSKISAQINEALERMRIKNDASRASLVQFHNGGHNLINHSFLKMDMTNEKVKLGVALLQSEFKDQYKDLFSYWCDTLAQNGFCYIENIDELKDKDTSMYNFLNSRHIISTYGVSINDSEGFPIGYISLDFMSGDSQDLENIKSCLADKKIKIETLLMLKQ